MTPTTDAAADPADPPGAAPTAPPDSAPSATDATPAPGALTRARRLLPESLVVVTAFVVDAWALSQNGYGNLYYAAAVRSMGSSLRNAAYGAYDPGGWITVDKPPLPYWVDTAVTKVFGFSSWTLLLPSAVCGAVAVALLIATIRPVWGRGAAIGAGVVLALTPSMVAVSRSNNPDAMLVMLAVAAAWATTVALRTGRTRWVLAAGGFVGLAFLTKLLAGFAVLPGLWLAYAVAGPRTWKVRLLQLLAGSAVVAILAVGWVAAMDLTRPGNEPYVGSSADGSARDLVLGYNGLGRLFGQTGPGGPGGAGGLPIGPEMLVGANGIDQFGGTPGPTRLFNNGMGDQITWLLPLALTAAGGALVLAVARRRRDARLGTAVLFLTWLVATAAVFSTAKGIFHNYYVSLLAPAVAALVGIGVALVRASGRVGRLVAAGALLATAVLQLVLLDRVEAWTWLRVVVPVGLVVAAVVLVLSVLPPTRRHAGVLVTAAAVGAVVVALAAPAAWSLSALQRPANGTFPDARPVDAGGFGAFAGPGGAAGGGPGGAGGLNPFGPGLSEAELVWLRDQRTSERWILALGSSMEASQAIADGDSIMAMGGFTGSDPAMTKERLADLVESGALRFVGAGGFSIGGVSPVTGVVTQVCTPVPAAAWGGTDRNPASVYDCRGKAAELRAATDVPTTGAGTAGPSAGGLPGGQLPGLPPGSIPANVTPEQMQFAMCVVQHGGTMQELLGLAGGTPPSPELQARIDQCGGLPSGPPPSLLPQP